MSCRASFGGLLAVATAVALVSVACGGGQRSAAERMDACIDQNVTPISEGYDRLPESLQAVPLEQWEAAVRRVCAQAATERTGGVRRWITLSVAPEAPS
ncbi:MAG: hypothetical protein ACR2OD_06815 [Gaiellaceae bacterium]